MVTLFKRPGAEEGLDARIAGLRQRRPESDVPEKPVPPPPPETAAPPTPPAPPTGPAAPAVPAAPPNPAAPVATSPQTAAPPTSLQEHLTVAREELVARLSAEI